MRKLLRSLLAFWQYCLQATVLLMQREITVQCRFWLHAGATQVKVTAENQIIYIVVSGTQESSVLVYDTENCNLIGSTSFEMPQGWSIDAIYKGTDRYLILITDDITTNSDGDKIGTSRLCSITKDGTLFLVKDLDQRAVWEYQLSDGRILIVTQSVLHGWPNAAFYLSMLTMQWTIGQA